MNMHGSVFILTNLLV